LERALRLEKHIQFQAKSPSRKIPACRKALVSATALVPVLTMSWLALKLPARATLPTGEGTGGRVELSDQRISVGEDLAYETGTEHVNVLIGKDKAQADFRVSNVFRREGSEWRLVHHHVDLNQTMLEILSKLETGRQTQC
jgi:hypothetical protein